MSGVADSSQSTGHANDKTDEEILRDTLAPGDEELAWTDSATRSELVDKIVSNTEICTDTGCWEWQGATTERGYGVLFVDGETRYVHRVSYRLGVGPIRKQNVNHRCDNRVCLNSTGHLYNGTQRDNVHDIDPVLMSESQSSLSADDVRDIRKRYERGELQKDLADEYGRDQSSISRIVTEDTWGVID